MWICLIRLGLHDRVLYFSIYLLNLWVFQSGCRVFSCTIIKCTGFLPLTILTYLVCFSTSIFFELVSSATRFWIYLVCQICGLFIHCCLSVRLLATHCSDLIGVFFYIHNLLLGVSGHSFLNLTFLSVRVFATHCFSTFIFLERVSSATRFWIYHVCQICGLFIHCCLSVRFLPLIVSI